MTATEEFRSLLDERGVEWDYGITGSTTTRFSVNGIDLTFTPMRDGLVCSTILTPEQAVEATLGPLVTGDTSDGYHTFNELYHHRAVLFSVIVRDHPEIAWKSKVHHDGTMFDGMFIVGIETPDGQATYHYDIDPYWEMFDCKELERAPEWDGHTPDEAIERIATLGRGTCCITDSGPWGYPYVCSECGASFDPDVNGGEFNFCPNCGRKVVSA